MAKSLRSKRQQKNRRQRREKYKLKEVKKLKEMLIAAGELVVPCVDSAMKHSNDVIVARRKTDAASALEPRASGDSQMQTDAPPGEHGSDFNPTTLRNEHGNYPPWMSQRRVRQMRRRGKQDTSSSDVFKKFRRRKRVL